MKTWQQIVCGSTAVAVALAVSCSDNPGNGGGTADLAGADLSASGGDDLRGGGGDEDLSGSSGDGGSGDGGGSFDFLGAAPTLSASNPEIGPSTGGTSVTLSGTAFGAGTTVLIGGNQATVTNVTPTQITVTLPAKPGTKGAVSVEVKNADGQSARRDDLFKYYYGTVQLDAAKAFTVGKQPVAVVLVDLTGDGKVEAVVSNQGDGTVQVLKGNGDGTFGAALATRSVGATSYRPYALAVADVSGDGKPDVITANNGNDTISVLAGDGAGGLGAPTAYGVGNAPYAVAAMDTNADGFVDVVTANAGTSSNLSYLAGKSGGLNAAVPLSAGMSPSAVAFGNVNGDCGFSYRGLLGCEISLTHEFMII